MKTIQGNKSKVRGGIQPPKRKVELKEASIDDVVMKNRRRPKEEDVSELPERIKVRAEGLHSIVPAAVWRQQPFLWKPTTFVAEDERLNSKIIETEVQDQSLMKFTQDPTLPFIYGVGGNPSDSKAKYFAAYLASLHIQHVGIRSNVLWYPMYEGFPNPIMDLESKPSLIVLTNLTASASNLKISKARDILEKYDSIPRIVVCAGADPMSYLACTLNVEISGIAYFIERMIKQKVEII